MTDPLTSEIRRAVVHLVDAAPLAPELGPARRRPPRPAYARLALTGALLVAFVAGVAEVRQDSSTTVAVLQPAQSSSLPEDDSLVAVRPDGATARLTWASPGAGGPCETFSPADAAFTHSGETITLQWCAGDRSYTFATVGLGEEMTRSMALTVQPRAERPEESTFIPPAGSVMQRSN